MEYQLNVRDEFLVGTRGVYFIQEKIDILKRLEAGRKPWPEHEGPWGDSDGEDNGAFEGGPGEQIPAEPGKDGDDDDTGIRFSDLRSLCESEMMLPGKSPEAIQALRAIEARLAETSLYLPVAIAGTQGKARAALEQLRSSL